jgi:hypothetical protein
MAELILNFIWKKLFRKLLTHFPARCGIFLVTNTACDTRWKASQTTPNRTERNGSETNRIESSVYGIFWNEHFQRKLSFLDTVLRLNIWYRNFQECDWLPNDQFVQLLTELKQLVLCYRRLLFCKVSTAVAKIICLLFWGRICSCVKNKKLAVLITWRYHPPPPPTHTQSDGSVASDFRISGISSSV